VVLITFEAPEELVRAHIPPGVDPDRWNGRMHVSLVALQMHDVRVLGWRTPGFATYPQVNFRTYVRRGADPAVTFLRQLVPSRLVAAVARLRYGEPFQTARVEARAVEHGDGVTVQYRFGRTAPKHQIVVTAARTTVVPQATSFEHHLTERTHGCRRGPDGRLRTFRVEHPPWLIRPVRTVDYEIDFGEVYGREWAFLNGRSPVSVVLAVGSDVAVYPPA